LTLTSIKRDVGTSSVDNVKIMTTHGAKGLQAPFVILCDTTNIPTNKDRFIWDKDGKFLSAKNSESVTEHYRDIKALKQDQEYAEYLRLLYVGMTRAEDHLVICGYQGDKKLPEKCWYELVRSVMLNMDTFEGKCGDVIYGKQEDSSLYEDNKIESATTASQVIMPSIDCLLPLKKTKKAESLREFDIQDVFPARSPLYGQNSLEYGLVFHKILEDSVNAKNLSIMQTHPLIQTLDKHLQKRILASTQHIISNKEFLPLVQKDTKTELSLGSIIDGKIKTVRLDLVVMDQDEIIIIDYKSDISVPLKAEDISEHYVKQLYTYKEMVKKIYPKRVIRSMILWLNNGHLHKVL